MIQVQLIAIYFAMLVFCKWCWLASPASVPIGGVETSSGIACPQDAGRSDSHSLKLQKHMGFWSGMSRLLRGASRLAGSR